MHRDSYEKFNKRFQIIEIQDINDMTHIIKDYQLSFFYTLTHGSGKDIYQFDNKDIWGNCKTIKHCVFETTYPEGDFYISIGNYINSKYNTNYLVIPHIVDLPIHHENLRNELQIPENAIVYGRYGGFHDFNILIAHNAIIEYIHTDENCYFLFMNTDLFYNHPRIIHLDKTVNLDSKTKFVNTCDLEHIQRLGDKAILYHSTEELISIFKNIKPILHSHSDWNAYKLCSPELVMNLFKTHIFDSGV
jgi:hypothetical protein